MQTYLETHLPKNDLKYTSSANLLSSSTDYWNPILFIKQRINLVQSKQFTKALAIYRDHQSHIVVFHFTTCLKGLFSPIPQSMFLENNEGCHSNFLSGQTATLTATPQNKGKKLTSLIISHTYNILQSGSMCKASIRRGRSLSQAQLDLSVRCRVHVVHTSKFD